jgi:hypothetical protein
MKLDIQMLELSLYATALLAAYQSMTNTVGFPLQVTMRETGHLVIESLNLGAGVLINPNEWKFRLEVLN